MKKKPTRIEPKQIVFQMMNAWIVFCCILVASWIQPSSLQANEPIRLATSKANTQLRESDTLFLTWANDPTSTMTAKWLLPTPPLPVQGQENPIQTRTGTIRIPYLSQIKIDANAADWQDKGYRLPNITAKHWRYLQSDAWQERPPTEFEAKLGWNESGLLLLFNINDDEIFAAKQKRTAAIRNHDGIEIYLSTGVEPWQRVRIFAGLDADHNAQFRVRDDRMFKTAELQPPTIKTRKTDSGFLLELQIQWQAFYSQAIEGSIFQLQIIYNDLDTTTIEKELALLTGEPGQLEMIKYPWFPAFDAEQNIESMYRIELSRDRSATAKARLSYQNDNNTVVLSTPSAFNTKKIAFFAGQQLLHQDQPKNGLIRFLLPEAAPGFRYDQIIAKENNQLIANIPLPIAGKYQRTGIKRAGIINDNNEVAWQNARKTPFGNAPFEVASVEFTGLQPDTQYRFQIEGDDEVYSFKTAPRTLNNNIRFLTGGDLDVSEATDRLHRLAAARAPLFAVLGGDLAYANGVQWPKWPLFLKSWSKLMRTAQNQLIPVVCAIGNHEVLFGYNQTRNSAPYFYALFDDLFTNRNYTVIDFGAYLSIFLLDSGHTSNLGPNQTSWFESELNRRFQTLYRIPIYHVPAYPAHREFENRGSTLVRNTWTPLIDKYKIPFVFENHDHVYKRTHKLKNFKRDENGSIYIGDGAWGQSTREVYPDRWYIDVAKSKRHFIEVDLSAQNAEIRAIDIDGEVIDQFEVKN